MKSLRDQSGFGWDETNQTVTADESVWEQYCSAHPDAAQFKNKGLPSYSNLEIIFEGRIATGTMASSSSMGATLNMSSPVEDDAVQNSSSTNTSSSSYDSNASSSSSFNTNKSGSSKSAEPGRANKKTKTDETVINLLNDIKTNQVNANAIRRALEKFNEFNINTIDNFTISERLTIKQGLSRQGTAEIYLSCTDDECAEFLASLLLLN